MHHKIEVRTLKVSAVMAKRINSVMLSAYREEARLLNASEFPPLNRKPDDIVRCGNRFLGAFRNTKLFGILEYREKSTEVIEICSLCVAPSHMGGGFGTALLRGLDAMYKQTLVVETEVRNIPAISLFQKLGYLATGGIRNTHDGFKISCFQKTNGA